MDTQTAEQLGRQARVADQPASPFANPEMYVELDGARVGEKTHLMEAFSRGWHGVNSRLADQQLDAEEL
ncbi:MULTISPECIES: hypothetical protein [unclassified Mycolicibacterium]|uniref:Uncharacterized protein n=1 Tax=Mycolicibacterium sp. CBMA 213 TaxID=1968788 RepID=A0A343VR86_9MYCO|nr:MULTISPECIES: hypothetical protein [unclassified Mycolicibacterium]AVN58410.1 hypothetical protein B5P44_p00115 [Mycolicibacterium sp. CBMA 213]MUL61068.1 hypothetical protein [Mycolicibacterium sp. CBMA 335]